MRNKVKIIYVSLFDAEVVILYGSHTEALLWVKKNCPLQTELIQAIEAHPIKRTVKATTYPQIGGGSLIVLPQKSTLSTTIHELTHAAFHLLKSRDTPLTEETEETYSYLIEFLVKHAI